MIELNKAHHCDWMHNGLPDKSVQLIIADPPYFEVKGDFDFVWKSFDDYLKDVERWALECKRVLADNGTLFWFGPSKRIAYSQIIFDKYFGLINNLTWEKAEADGLFGSTGSEQLRSFPNSTERILMYSNESNGSNKSELNYSYQIGLKHTEIMRPLIDYMVGEMKAAGFDCNKVNKATGTKMASHWFAYTSQWALPTKEWYSKLQAIFNDEHLRKDYEHLRKDYEHLRKDYEHLRKDYEELRKDYEELRKDYEELRRPFDNFSKSTEVIKVRFVPSEFDHDTVKPEKLTRALILTCSRPNDLVLVPFAGSGTECAMSEKEGRRWIGFDITEKYVNMTNKRVEVIRKNPTLF